MEIVMKQEYDLEVVLLGIISIAALASFLGFHWVEAVVNITSINGDSNSTWIWQQAAAPIQYHVFRTTNPGSTGNALGGYYFEGYDASGTGIYFGDITGYEANVTASKTYGEIIVHANDNGTSDSYLILNYH